MSDSKSNSKNSLRPSLLDGTKFALGCAIGGMSVLVFCIWISLDSISQPKDSTLLGAVVGGVIAGSVSLLSTVLGSYYSAKEAQAQLADRLEATAASCFQKVHAMRDTLLKAYRHYFDGSEHNIVRYGAPDEPPRQLPKPLAFSKIDRMLSDEELRLPLELKEVEFFNLLGELDNYVFLYNELSDAYLNQFNAFQEVVLRAPTTSFNGRQVHGAGVAIHPIEVLAVEDFRDHIQNCVMGGLKTAIAAHTEIIRVFQTRFGRNIEFLEDPEMSGHISFASLERG